MVHKKKDQIVPKPKSRFLRIKCLNCGAEQIVFGCATSTVHCIVCEKELTQSTGGKARILTKITEVLPYPLCLQFTNLLLPSLALFFTNLRIWQKASPGTINQCL